MHIVHLPRVNDVKIFLTYCESEKDEKNHRYILKVRTFLSCCICKLFFFLSSTKRETTPASECRVALLKWKSVFKISLMLSEFVCGFYFHFFSREFSHAFDDKYICYFAIIDGHHVILTLSIASGCALTPLLFLLEICVLQNVKNRHSKREIKHPINYSYNNNEMYLSTILFIFLSNYRYLSSIILIFHTHSARLLSAFFCDWIGIELEKC